MRKNVLIYPGNGYLAEQIYFCLQYSMRYRPIVGNHGHAPCEYITEDFIPEFPLITETNFLVYLNDFISKNAIAFIIPTHDTVTDYLAENQSKINATIVCSDRHIAHICRHKTETYEVLKDCEFLPKIYHVGDDMVFPIFAKDDIGQGGKNSAIVNSSEELEQLLNNTNINYVLSEYLPGDEITVDCFTNKNHELLLVQPRQRVSILTGMSGKSKVLKLTDEIKYIAEAISKIIDFRGYWFFQCKKDQQGRFKLMEVSTRIASSFTLVKDLDVNIPLLALTDFDGLDVTIAPNDYDITADRGYVMRLKPDIRYDRVYLDFDDSLVSNRETFILPTMTFLFQCLNHKKEVILLTRHAYNIMETLDHLHIDPRLFSQIIEVEDDKKKSDYIRTDKPCIFVDNAFAERLNVKQTLGVPTFDVCNLDCLLEAIY